MRENLLVLERRYQEAAHLLEVQLSQSPNESPGEGGEDWQFLGWARSLAGDKEGARKAYLEGKARLELRQQQEPGNYSVASFLGFCEAGLGNKETALREGDVRCHCSPRPKIAVFRPVRGRESGRDRSAGRRTGARDRRIERLLTTPYGAFPLNQALLRLDPVWDPLRQHPRFKAIVEGPEPKTVYQ